ncbi:MAG: DUF2252 domain-containing protein [Acidimicrobiales bacterium]
MSELIPVRHGRMMESPFAFYRGSPAIMAADLSRTPASGVTLQICGDAHLLNFGSFATPERILVFDVNDFDETQPGPWEWDLKRLAASLVIAARTGGLTDADGETAVLSSSAAYRSEMEAMSELSAFEVWHSRLDVASLLAAAPDQRSRSILERGVSKARHRTSLKALPKLTTVRDGRRVILEDPPLVSRLTEEQVQLARRSVWAYFASLDADRRMLLDHYEFVDAASKVVGVGSVGTRCFVVLLAGKADLDPLFLQIKEARASVLAPYVGRSQYRNHGRRVVVGQRIMQAASDTFLGLARIDGFNFYVRQLRDMKLSVRLESLLPMDLAIYGRLCGATLARAHARAGEPAVLAGYLGSGAVFDEAMAAFAVGYADQNERDYEAFLGAIRSGRLESVAGSG